ncbi:hypothetical protein KHP60_16025 [Microvirga sp. 3-52]|uniref:hypothetical protein n=1 Tax=Microvirga sp. 3-52 TaxID=2792425 RepID=UPI001AC021A4|nr:hypothetical protein [Microvirga sp. 3-52]MBO1906564.1 hypothetical protein [Microvirga sp. 3-52]MBS7453839.1 hypothetical protein [Microvirga sp. 3-52]
MYIRKHEDGSFVAELGWSDPLVTFPSSIDHDRVVLHREVRSWLEENTPLSQVREGEKEVAIAFVNEEDAWAFNSRWGQIEQVAAE